MHLTSTSIKYWTTICNCQLVAS